MTRKALVLGCSIFTAVSLLVVIARPAYCRYREQSALRRGKLCLAQGDLHTASLCVRQALVNNPRSLNACLLMAEMAEAAGSPQMLDWRSRVVELAPTLENKLSLAAAALRVESAPYPRATELLNQLRPSASNRVAYCNLSANLAMKLGLRQEAETWFESARRLQPTNLIHQLNLAVLRLGSTNPLVAAEARSSLMSMRSDTNFAPLVLRSLVADSLIRKDLAGARRLSTELATRPDAVFSDRLQHLDLLAQPGVAGFQEFLTSMLSEASTNAAAAYEVAACMIRHGLADTALHWLTNCAPQVQTTQPFPLAKVSCLCALKDWAGMEKFLGERKWGDFEPMRLAWLSRAAFELHDLSASDLRWRLAVKQAHRRLGSLIWLTARAQEWGRDRARVDLLWEVLKQFPAERWAFDDLCRYYAGVGDTRGLHQLYTWMTSPAPEDRALRNNFSLTALLLKTNQDLAHETASELYVQFPGDPAIVSTRAYSLSLQGRTKEALDTLERLDEPILARPDIALYYGALLQAEHQCAKAQRYLGLVQPDSLLPEERELLASCLRQPAASPDNTAYPHGETKARP